MNPYINYSFLSNLEGQIWMRLIAENCNLLKIKNAEGVSLHRLSLGPICTRKFNILEGLWSSITVWVARTAEWMMAKSMPGAWVSDAETVGKRNHIEGDIIDGDCLCWVWSLNGAFDKSLHAGLMRWLASSTWMANVNIRETGVTFLIH